MKTTIELPDSLVAEARELAAREGTTLRALVEAGLRRAVNRRPRGRSFRLRDASVDGKGLTPGFADASWERLREAVYDGRGT